MGVFPPQYLLVAILKTISRVLMLSMESVLCAIPPIEPRKILVVCEHGSHAIILAVCPGIQTHHGNSYDQPPPQMIRIGYFSWLIYGMDMAVSHVCTWDDWPIQPIEMGWNHPSVFWGLYIVLKNDQSTYISETMYPTLNPSLVTVGDGAWTYYAS